MIWYLLYPFRGTTVAPILSSQHPLRRIFYNHGKSVARHWYFWILGSTITGLLLCYPVFYLYHDALLGSNVPHNVWISSRIVPDRSGLVPDIELRQIWVYGDYMHALNRSVLLEALDIQSYFTDHLGPTSLPRAHSFAQPGNLSWGIHSPLLYWNASSSLLSRDGDLIETINTGSYQRSTLNVTLRPTSVFAGKSFNKNKLSAADALVITFVIRPRLGIGETWDRLADEIDDHAQGRWHSYPKSGFAARSRLLEARVKPATFQDDVILGLAYSIMLGYLIVCLRKAPWFKHRLGLIITVLTQIGTSVLSSFTICALFDINLTQMPRAAYPFVIFVIGIENMFRLINAVLKTPPEMPVQLRIANALSDVGHLALAATFQNVVLLSAMARVVTPGVEAFCYFAQTAISFDFFFHLTFLVAVLSVDVRRTELHDCLSRAQSTKGTNSSQSYSPARQQWHVALLRGQVPISTRVAGTAILVCFTMMLNFSHFDAISQVRFLIPFSGLLKDGLDGIGAGASIPASLNQVRTPSAWLRLQDFNTAKEIMTIAGPDAHRFSARIFDPLFVVLRDANRSNVVDVQPSFIGSLRDIVHEHSTRIFVIVVFALAVVTVLMNFLLWDEISDGATRLREEEAPLEAHNLEQRHSLDIISLVGCFRGHMVSVALDRSIFFWVADSKLQSYQTYTIQGSSVDSPIWPIENLSLDDTGECVAFHTRSGLTVVWRLIDQSLVPLRGLILHDTTKLFTLQRMDGDGTITLLVVTDTKSIHEINPMTMQYTTKALPSECSVGGDLLRARYESAESTPTLTFYYADCALVLRRGKDSEWTVQHQIPIPKSADGILVNPTLNLVVTFEKQCTVFTDISDPRKFIWSNNLGGGIASQSQVYYSNDRVCPLCGSMQVASLTLVMRSGVDKCCICAFTAVSSTTGTSARAICLRGANKTLSPDAPCQTLSMALQRISYEVQARHWITTDASTVVGVRQAALEPPPSPRRDTSRPSPSLSAANASQIRSRHARSLSGSKPMQDGWTVFTRSPNGTSHDLLLPVGNDELLVTEPGPMCTIGKSTVAIAMGNMIKIVHLKSEGGGGGGGVRDLSLGLGMAGNSAAAGSYRKRSSSSRKGTIAGGNSSA